MKESYDVVVIAEVLEHLHSPHLAVENLRNTLRPNGRLVLTVPFIFPIPEAPSNDGSAPKRSVVPSVV